MRRPSLTKHPQANAVCIERNVVIALDVTVAPPSGFNALGPFENLQRAVTQRQPRAL